MSESVFLNWDNWDNSQTVWREFCKPQYGRIQFYDWFEFMRSSCNYVVECFAFINSFWIFCLILILGVHLYSILSFRNCFCAWSCRITMLQPLQFLSLCKCSSYSWCRKPVIVQNWETWNWLPDSIQKQSF